MVSSTCIILVTVAMMSLFLTAQSETIDQDRAGGELSLLQKRPFCNAFTGCGRKRSHEIDMGDRSAQNRAFLYALVQQKMAEIQALRAILDEEKTFRGSP